MIWQDCTDFVSDAMQVLNAGTSYFPTEFFLPVVVYEVLRCPINLVCCHQPVACSVCSDQYYDAITPNTLYDETTAIIDE